MNSKNSNTSHPHILLLNLSDKLYFKRSDKYVAVSNLSIYYTWENIKKVIRKQSTGRIWNEKFELPDESYILIFKTILSIS